MNQMKIQTLYFGAADYGLARQQVLEAGRVLESSLRDLQSAVADEPLRVKFSQAHDQIAKLLKAFEDSTPDPEFVLRQIGEAINVGESFLRQERGDR